MIAGEEWTVGWATGRSSEVKVTLACGEQEPEEHSLRVLAREGDSFEVDIDGVRETWRILKVGGSSETLEDGDTLYVHTGRLESFAALKPRFPSPSEQEAEPGSCTAPTPGTVVAVHVSLGEAVEPGQKLVTLEAMKMEHRVTAPNAGSVENIRVEVGETVDEGTLLIQLSVDEE
jgi:biotin carboxyl carrier protein